MKILIHSLNFSPGLVSKRVNWLKGWQNQAMKLG